jgi:hypothetical protein
MVRRFGELFFQLEAVWFFQAEAVTNMIGFPEYILNATRLDDRYKEVSAIRMHHIQIIR